MNTAPASLLQNHLPLLQQSTPPGPVLDLACGQGRNGLFLARQGFDLHFIDRDADALANIRQQLANEQLRGQCQAIDLEQPVPYALPEQTYSVILVFRYLHRPLLNHIANALKPGGILIYETFTRAQAEIGRPRNPDFLLEPGELTASFQGWEVIEQFEGMRESPRQAIAQLVTRKPEQ